MAKEQEYTTAELIQLIEFCAEFTHDPVKFVWAMYPWGEGELAGKKPSQWQLDLLTDIRDGLKTPGEVIQEAIASGHGIGKALTLTTEVDTPNGKRVWGSIKPGDLLFGKGGQIVKVVATRKYNYIPIYRVMFDDDSYCDVSSGHLWNVKGRRERRNKRGWVTMSTIDILKAGVKRSNGITMARQWEIPQQDAVQYPHVDTPLHPYLLGVWLGDGHRNASIYSKPDAEIKDKLSELGYEISTGTKNRYYIKKIKHLFNAELLDCNSFNRFIPDEYKHNDAESRKELLSGLMDTDGECSKNGSMVYSSTSRRLALDVIWLVRSLGGKAQMQPTAKIGKYDGELCHDCFRVTLTLPFNPFNVKHKGDRYKAVEPRYLKRWIESIEYIGDEDAMCVEVDSADSQYLANDFIVTHNSALVCWLIQWAMATFEDCKGVVTANTKDQLVTKTWSELAKWHRLSLCRPMFNYSATAYYSADPKHEKTWRIDALPWNKDHSESFAGLHNQGKRILVIFDEASAIDNVIWEVIEGALTDSDTEIVWAAFGNPTRNSGRFYDCFNRFRKFWKTKQIDSRDVPISNKAQIKRWIDQYGIDSDIIRVRVLGQFPRQSDLQLISIADVEAAMARYRNTSREQYKGQPCIFGIDPAYTGADEFVIKMRQGNYEKTLLVEQKTEDYGYMAGRIARLADEYNMTYGFIDQGYGIAVFSYLKDMGLGNKFKLVPFNEKPANSYYANKRIEMWDAMKQWIKEGGAIEPSDVMRNDLIGPEAFINARGKLQLESKDDMKDRGLPSPNYADALALTFAEPIKLNPFNRLAEMRLKGRMPKAGCM